MKYGVLRRADLLVLKNKAANDSAQVPASGAAVDVFKAGPVVSQTAILLGMEGHDPPPPPTQPIEVHDIRNIAAGDVVRLGPTGIELTVDSVDSAQNKIYVEYSLPDDTTVQNRTHLYVVSNRAGIYADPYGEDTLGTGTLLTDASGRTGFYASDRRVDVLISSSAFPTRGLPDIEGGPRGGDVAWLNARDFPSLQDAVNAIPSPGGVVYLPAGSYSPRTVPAFNPPLVLPHNRGVRLVGDGIGATILWFDYMEPGWDPTKDMIQVTGDSQSVESMWLRHGAIFQGGPGVGVRVRRTAGGQIIYGVVLRDLLIEKPPSFGVAIDGTPLVPGGPEQWAIYCIYDNVEVRDAKQDGGFYVGGGGTTTQYFLNCHSRNNAGTGMFINKAHGVNLINCILEEAYATGVRVIDGVNILVEGCWLEGLSDPNVDISGASYGVAVKSCTFNTSRGQLRCVRIGGSAKGVEVSNIQVSQTAEPVDPHVVIEVGCETLISGGVVSGPLDVAHELIVQDDSDTAKSVLVGSMWRFRLPVLTMAERDSLRQVKPGDMVMVLVLGTETGGYVAQIWDGTMWRSLWAPPTP
ncbi:MAG: right-handed parallel beta-helix repeat-containing protein [Candidatus Eisenbacteria bacterium]|nr:right-handed parallel beta-helix repeat-containing protein [Candidatus Eisenbacteria bacterium]